MRMEERAYGKSGSVGDMESEMVVSEIRCSFSVRLVKVDGDDCVVVGAGDMEMEDRKRRSSCARSASRVETVGRAVVGLGTGVRLYPLVVAFPT